MIEKHISSDKLTVVIRTHDRPAAFKRCIESVRMQTHKNIDIIVGVDTPGSMEYAETYHPTRIIKCESRERKSHNDFPADEYISKLFEPITDGYILVLDDDNYLADPKGVEKLLLRITQEYCIYIIRYRYPDGRLFPNDQQFQSKRIKNGGIDWASCVFHARFKNTSKTLPLYNADFHFISKLVEFVKKTEWIDLALVHTDTPGNHGKTEKSNHKVNVSPAQTVERTGDIDVVYVLGTGSKWNDNEIRFSLRSLEKNLKGFRQVFVVGANPEFLQNVIHLEAEDIFDPAVNADGNIIHKVLAACADERLADDFLFINDDHLVLQPMEVGEIPAFHKGNMLDFRPMYWELNYWRKRLLRTMETLFIKGLPAFHYDCHTPILFNKTRFIEIMSGFDYAEGIGLTMKSLYGNSVYAESGILLTDQKKTIFKNYTLQELNERLASCQFMSFNDMGLNRPLMYWLWKMFPDKSQFETNDISVNLIDICRWLESDRDFNEGIRIFKKYLHGVNLLKMFESGETPSLRKKLEYKLERNVDDINGN